MKVKDLIEELQKLNPESEIGIHIQATLDDAPYECDIERVDGVPEPMIVSV